VLRGKCDRAAGDPFRSSLRHVRGADEAIVRSYGRNMAAVNLSLLQLHRAAPDLRWSLTTPLQIRRPGRPPQECDDDQLLTQLGQIR
jgi:hypothetical protein